MSRLKLPNLLTNPVTKQTYIINNREYTFTFRWIEEFCTLDIYIIQDGQRTYLVKGIAIALDSDIISRVKNDSLISGSLYLINKYGETGEPTQDNFHTDYEMEYYEQDI